MLYEFFCEIKQTVAVKFTWTDFCGAYRRTRHTGGSGSLEAATCEPLDGGDGAVDEVILGFEMLHHFTFIGFADIYLLYGPLNARSFQLRCLSLRL